MITRLVIPLIALLTACTSLAQGVVTLRPVARIELGSPITLGDVALLSGEAEPFKSLVIDDQPSDRAGADRRLDITLDDIRTKLASQAEFSAGRMTLRGETCRVILRTRTANAADTIKARPTVSPDSVGATVKDHIEAKLVQTFGVPIDQLQLTYQDNEAALLASPTEGWAVDVQPIGSSDTMPMRITMYDARGNIRDETARVGVRILRQVVRTTRALRRGDTLEREDYETDAAWLAPDVPFIEPTAVGAIRLRRNIGAGEMLTTAHAEQAEVIKRGDVVSVHVISGTIVMRSPARALASGRVGDTIEFEPLQGEGRFMAQVKAPGRAVVVTGATTLTGANG
ncbi:MAG: flagellar basal body P-ring formation protein FlgA [Phycisphaera sp.]|nr:flagellar basal body P-ring formation protein FlgA [Phycisphaera sp.]